MREGSVCGVAAEDGSRPDVTGCARRPFGHAPLLFYFIKRNIFVPKKKNVSHCAPELPSLVERSDRPVIRVIRLGLVQLVPSSGGFLQSA
jgi:hypothetical protein